MQTTTPVAILVLLGVVLVAIGLFLAGNILVIALGVAAVAFGAFLQVWGQRKS
jgi:hypothetical protein